MTHAVKHYERVLEIAENNLKESGEQASLWHQSFWNGSADYLP